MPDFEPLPDDPKHPKLRALLEWVNREINVTRTIAEELARDPGWSLGITATYIPLDKLYEYKNSIIAKMIHGANSAPESDPATIAPRTGQRPAKTTTRRRGRTAGKVTKTDEAFRILQGRLKDGDSLDIREIAKEAGIADPRQLTRPGRFQRWYEQAIKAGEDLRKAHEREGLGRPHDSIDGEAVTWDREVDLDGETERDAEEKEGRITERGYFMPDVDEK
jgi:hypothetical protein